MLQGKLVNEEKKPRKFIIVTNDNYAGFGFAVKEIEENGSEVIIGVKFNEELNEEEAIAYDAIGEGLVNIMELDYLIKNRADYKDYYWIWDGNNNTEEGELLKSEGFKVWGGTKFTYDLENDRQFGMDFAASCGLHSSEQQEFKSAEDGIEFLEERENESFVFKPNGGNDNSMTYVPINKDPEKANLELRKFIEAFANDEFTSSYILQAMVKGVEVNVEGYFINGQCVFAHANFEEKKSYQESFGSAQGCSYDIDFEISMDSKLYNITVGRMAPKLREMNYTGLADVNCLIGDFDQVYFIEYCFRVGINMAINFHYNLCNKTFLQTAADMIDGITDIQSKKGFGATITMYTDKFHTGLPLDIPDNLKKDVYLFDAYQEDGDLRMAGLSKEILVVCGHGYTISETLHDVEGKCRKIIFKDRYFRLDTWEHKSSRSPQRRFEALNAMRLLQ